HTRSYGDWSSDVCSSDLLLAAIAPWLVFAATATWTGGPGACFQGAPWSTAACWNNGAGPVPSNGDDVVWQQVGNNRPQNYDLNEIGRASCRERVKSKDGG